MWPLLFLVYISMLGSHSHRLPQPKNEFRFPIENDIVFPNDRPPPRHHYRELFDIERHLIDYHDNHISSDSDSGSESQEWSDRRQSPRPPYPGELFPPPPGGRRHRNNTRKGSRRLCEIKYSEYVERIFPGDTNVAADANDSEFDGRVLARPGQYPHMAAVGFETNGSAQIDYKCGGSLISEKFVITAAHCTAINGQQPTKVRLGDLNLMIDDQQEDPQMHDVQTIHNHPKYRDEVYYNDIALLELKREVDLTEFVRPIRLWIRSELPTAIAFAMGYGATSFAKAQTNRLTNMNLTIVDNVECNNSLPALSETPNGIVSSQICARDFIMNRDTCQGDSGGPLQLNLPGKRNRRRIHYHLVGVTSYGIFCRSTYPSVYTRVSAFLDWIESVAWLGK